MDIFIKKYQPDKYPLWKEASVNSNSKGFIKKLNKQRIAHTQLPSPQPHLTNQNNLNQLRANYLNVSDENELENLSLQKLHQIRIKNKMDYKVNLTKTSIFTINAGDLPLYLNNFSSKSS